MSNESKSPEPETRKQHFIEAIIAEELKEGRHKQVHTRFPPEPNGYLHIGHAKAICINFGLAQTFGGLCNLRFDDTNPAKESTEYVEAQEEDIRWLGWEWDDRLFFTSSYFERLYELAQQLIEKGKAYVCDLPLETVREQRGKPGEAGTPSPYRERSVEENLDLFARMRAGEFEEGSRTLRAKVDMAAANMLLRDPVMYRILRVKHHRTDDAWSIYPTYDWAHGQSDAIEGITHSLCSIEFVNHRPLYDWFLDHLDGLASRPRQIEFARLVITHTITSKRYLRRLIDEGHLEDWDDPRMPTIRGMRRRGYPPAALRAFCDTVGVTKVNSTIDAAVLENHVRDELNRTAERRMGVLRPLKLVIENYPEGQHEELEAINNPEDESAGTRKLPFGREVFIDRDDFMEDPPRKFFRLGPGREVRLRYAYCVTCTEVVKDDAGEIVELRGTYDPETGGGKTPDGRKVKGIIHWVSAPHALRADVRLYDHLFKVPDPLDVEEGADFIENLNEESLVTRTECALEPSLADATPGTPYQFERVGYFVADPKTSKPGAPRFHRTVALRDSWAKKAKKK